MIQVAELKRIAAKQKVGLSVIEKDYALTWVLYGLSQTGYKNNFIFKGGTALRKMYFHDWRYSEDLDFTLPKGLNREEISAAISLINNYTFEKAGIALNAKSIHINPEYAQAKIQFIGPLGGKNTIKLDLSFNEQVVLKPSKRQIISDYSDRESHFLLAYTLEEILAEKIRSILQRGKTRDFYDVWKILKFHLDIINKPMLKETLLKKCNSKGLELKEKELFNPRIIDPARDYWKKALAHQINDLPEFNTIIAECRELIKLIL